MAGLKVIAALATACVVVATSAGTARAAKRTAAAAAASAPCKSYELHRYPGSSNLRYGEVVFTVFVCPNQKPSSWVATTRDPTTNATGANLGFTLANTSVKVSKIGQNKWNRYARYEGSFTSGTCVPRIKWPCVGTGDWKVRFTITADKKSHKVHLFFQGGTTPGSSLVLYPTP